MTASGGGTAALPAPRHINQLTAGGHFPNGQPSGRYDCTPASAIMALDAYSRGALHPTITDFRRRQTDNDTSGMGLDDAATAWRSYGQTLIHGPMTWAQVMARLRRGLGVVLQGQSGALGPYKVGRSVAHAIYVQRVGSTGALVVDDPLRSAAVLIPEHYVRAFYLSGLALAGYGKGTYSGAAPAGVGARDDWATNPGSGWLYAFGTLIGYPVGHVLTSQDVRDIIVKLRSSGLIPPGPDGEVASVVARGILMRHVGEPWSKALQDRLAAEFGASAIEAGRLGSNLDAGLGAVGSAIAGLPEALGLAFGKLALLGGIVVLGLMGAWLAVKGEAPTAIRGTS